MRHAAALVLLSSALLRPEPVAASTAHVAVKSVRLTDNGDNDGFADPHETVNVFLTLQNGSDTPRTGIRVALATQDPDVDCLVAPVISFGSLAARESRESAAALTFRVAGISRSSINDEIAATFDVLIWGDGFAGAAWPQRVTLDLDLNVSGGLFPTTLTEGFEAGTFGTFTTMTLDVGKASFALSEGHRCQYNMACEMTGSGCPPDSPCYLGFPNAADNAFDWHVHGSGSPDGGRAYLGNNSLHWGVHDGPPSMDTTRLKQLDAVQTTAPFFPGWNGVTSELSFKHQAWTASSPGTSC